MDDFYKEKPSNVNVHYIGRMWLILKDVQTSRLLFSGCCDETHFFTSRAGNNCPSEGFYAVVGSSIFSPPCSVRHSLEWNLARLSLDERFFVRCLLPVWSTGLLSAGANSAAGGQALQPAACDISLATVGVIAQKSAERLRSVFIAAHRGERLRYEELDLRRLPMGGR